MWCLGSQQASPALRHARLWVAGWGQCCVAGTTANGCAAVPVNVPSYASSPATQCHAAELCSLYDWQRLAASGKSSRCAWYFPGLLTVSDKAV